MAHGALKMRAKHQLGCLETCGESPSEPHRRVWRALFLNRRLARVHDNLSDTKASKLRQRATKTQQVVPRRSLDSSQVQMCEVDDGNARLPPNYASVDGLQMPPKPDKDDGKQSTE